MKTTTSKKSIFFITSTILVISTCIVVGHLLKNDGKKSTVVNPRPVNSVDYSPATKNETQQANDQKKKNLAAEQRRDAASSSPDTGQPTKTDIVITDAGVYSGVLEVRAFMPNYYENGTCTIKLTQGSLVVSRQTSANTDVSTTICTNPLIKTSELPAKGSWSVVISYASKSGNATGMSAPRIVNVP